MTLCGLCVDNVGSYTVKIDTGAGTTGPVPICWPCLTDRLDKLRHDLGVGLHGTGQVKLGGITGFTVATAPPLPF